MSEKKTVVWLILLGLMLSGGSLMAQSFSKVGQAGATFLKIDIGARAVAMGGAQVAATNDASALFWNPAGIGFLSKRSFHFAYNQWIADISHSFVAIGMPLGNIGSVGISLTSLGYGEMEETTITNPDGTGIMFGANDFAIGLSYARQLTDKFVTGISVKFVRQKVWDLTASGICFDIGTIFQTPFEGLRFGVVVTNFGQNLAFDGQQLIRKDKVYNDITVTSRYETESFQLPVAFKMGIAYEILRSDMNRFMIAIDGVHPNDNLEYANFGAEYIWANMVALRAGYKANTDIQGLSAGAGFRLALGNVATRFDYAYSDLEFFNGVHRFSVGIDF
ncbi:MAG: PorV/PorQ family protein [candidate division KSB1 bacterium]|nr:PorV/PorQ family protein [candidate division KSB1 bacterium]MDZ7319855.1 PorV/PorQ family protein [candidate division KSB1 bacterium]MDZ7340542.1 PorV/PorQ family protein [candidate division KSB1 bacterium]